MKIEKLLKKTYKAFFIILSLLFALIFLFIYILYLSPHRITGSAETDCYIVLGLLVVVTIAILFGLLVKIPRINKALSRNDIDEINRYLNNHSDGNYPKMSVFITNKVLISATFSYIIDIIDIQSICISSKICYSKSKQGEEFCINILLKNGEEVIFYKRAFYDNTTILIIKNEICQFGSKIRNDFPYVNLVSNINTTY
ncbi:MAG: hypothetical protein PUG48_11510 [Clostridia bacterium]|nr:hypothetical protein [Clostridia bacterium]